VTFKGTFGHQVNEMIIKGSAGPIMSISGDSEIAAESKAIDLEAGEIIVSAKVDASYTRPCNISFILATLGKTTI
jgi:hypothetical protein